MSGRTQRGSGEQRGGQAQLAAGHLLHAFPRGLPGHSFQVPLLPGGGVSILWGRLSAERWKEMGPQRRGCLKSEEPLRRFV